MEFAIRITEMFIAFFLANIASRYVKDYIDKKLRVGQVKDEHDIEMANKIINLIDKETIEYLEHITTGGTLPRELNDSLLEVKRIGEYDKFYNKETQKNFKDFHIKLIKLKEFYSLNFSPKKGDDSSFEIHRYHHAPNGQEMYEESVDELYSLLDKFKYSYYEFEEIVRDKYPSVFLDNNKEH